MIAIDTYPLIQISILSRLNRSNDKDIIRSCRVFLDVLGPLD